MNAVDFQIERRRSYMDDENNESGDDDTSEEVGVCLQALVSLVSWQSVSSVHDQETIEEQSKACFADDASRGLYSFSPPLAKMTGYLRQPCKHQMMLQHTIFERLLKVKEMETQTIAIGERCSTTLCAGNTNFADRYQ